MKAILPANGGNPGVGCETGDSEVSRCLSELDFQLDDNAEDLQSSRSGISRNQFGNGALELLSVVFSREKSLVITYSNAHAAKTRDEPTPYNRTTATGEQWVRHGGHDGGKETTNADRERKGRQVPKFSLEDWVIAEPGGQFGVVLGEVGDRDFSVLAIRADDVDLATFMMALAKLAGFSNLFGVHFRHDCGLR